jgi:hypothetical protein
MKVEEFLNRLRSLGAAMRFALPDLLPMLTIGCVIPDAGRVTICHTK